MKKPDCFTYRAVPVVGTGVKNPLCHILKLEGGQQTLAGADRQRRK